MSTPNLPTDPKARKTMPMARGLLDYFPDACAAVAHVSFVGNEQHNPGQPMHWARGKSSDHADCIVRHLIERGSVDTDGLAHSAKLAWRALANLQIEIEDSRNPADEDVASWEDGPAVGSDARTACELVAATRPAGNNVYLVTEEGVFYLDAADGEVVEVPCHMLTGPGPQIAYCHASEHPAEKVVGRIDKDGVHRYDEGPNDSGCHHGDDFDLNCGFCHAKLHLLTAQTPSRKPRCYIAGPMRGYPKFNFPAFDDARDLAISKGWDPISPADIDREEGIDENTEQGSTDGPASSRVFAERDCKAIISLRAEGGDALALLPGWTKSTGARAEFFLACWVGLKIVDATTMQPFAVRQVQDLWDNIGGPGLGELKAAAFRKLCEHLGEPSLAEDFNADR